MSITMKLKMANRFIFNNKKTILTRAVILFAGILIALNLHGDSSGDSGANNYAPDITNPFHDIFNLYFNNEKKEASNFLKKLFNNKKLKNQAYINYGLIQELEKNYPEAEKYYKMALANNEKISILYLNNLYKNYDKEKLLPLLSTVKNHEENYWTLYEQSIYYLEIDDGDKALGCLSEAIDKGFSSVDLLQNDPSFNNIKNTFKFKWLVHRAKNNIIKSKSIIQKLKETEYKFLSDKIYGVSRELDAATNYEKAGKDNKALNILESLLQSKLSFRDRSTTLFWLARINARIGNEKTAKQYLRDFTNYVSGQEKDDTGYKDLIFAVYKDIIANDESLKKISGE
jgi:tetratricopeptide (TPR) repeat protein